MVTDTVSNGSSVEVIGTKARGCLTTRLAALRDALLEGLVERDVAIRLALLATLAGEHLLMVGPPGTAKSLIGRRLHLAFEDAHYFERLLTRFTVPEELFGPLSIKGLEEDRYERLTHGYLPKAGIAFLDEVFKANSAILNALLTLLNEREFDNGARRERTPLIAVIGASNELPEGNELDALFDRFLLRLHVGPVSEASFGALLALRGEAVVTLPSELRLTADDVAEVEELAQLVSVPDDVVAMLRDLRAWCMAEGITVSDRRWRKVVKLLKVAALTNGRDAVSIWDCWLIQHCLWNAPEAHEKLAAWYSARVGASAAMDPTRLTRIVLSWEGKLAADRASRSQARDAQGRPLFVGADGKHTTSKSAVVQAKRGEELLFLAPANAMTGEGYGMTKVPTRNSMGRGFTVTELDKMKVPDEYGQHRIFTHWKNRDAYLADTSNWLMKEGDLPPAMEPTRQKAAYVRDCLENIASVHADVETYATKLEAHRASLEAQIRAHLWVMPEFAEPAAQTLDATRHEVDTLLARVRKLRQGFEMLPREREETEVVA